MSQQAWRNGNVPHRIATLADCAENGGGNTVRKRTESQFNCEPVLMKHQMRTFSYILEQERTLIRTGCGRDDTDGLAQALEKYIGSRHKPTIGATDPRILSIADILTFYETLKRPRSQDPRKLADHELLLIRLLDLNTFFGAREVLEFKAQLCRDFVD